MMEPISPNMSKFKVVKAKREKIMLYTSVTVMYDISINIFCIYNGYTGVLFIENYVWP